MAQQIIRDFFIYTTGRFAIAPAANSLQTINIQKDADFEINKLTFSADIAGAAITGNTFPIPNVTVLITDSGSGRNLMNQAVPLEALFGIGKDVFILQLPRVLMASSQITLSVTSFEAANTMNISLNMIGYKLFAL